MTNLNNGDVGKFSDVIDEILQDKGTIIIWRNEVLTEELASVRKSYNSENWEALKIEEFTVSVPDETIAKHIAFFNYFFEPFLDKNSGMMGVSSVIRGAFIDSSMTMHDFIKMHVTRAAVFLGAEKVGRMLVDWKTKNQLKFNSKFYFRGIHLDSDLLIESHGKLLTPTRKNFDSKLSASSNKLLECDVGAIASIERSIGSVFYKPETPRENTVLTEARNFMVDFNHCLALVLNAKITLICQWLYDKELKPFFTKNSITNIDTVERTKISQKVIQPNVFEAQEIMSNFIRMVQEEKKFRVAIENWIASKYSKTTYEEFSNLRTSLEALFTNEGMTSSSDRIAIVSSRYLRFDPLLRKEVHDQIKYFYSDASDIIHGDLYDAKKARKRNRTDINAIQGFCSEAIVKILKAGEIPDWTSIALD